MRTVAKFTITVIVPDDSEVPAVQDLVERIQEGVSKLQTPFMVMLHHSDVVGAKVEIEGGEVDG